MEVCLLSFFNNINEKNHLLLTSTNVVQQTKRKTVVITKVVYPPFLLKKSLKRLGFVYLD